MFTEAEHVAPPLAKLTAALLDEVRTILREPLDRPALALAVCVALAEGEADPASRAAFREAIRPLRDRVLLEQ